jgi:hypothetical protein
MGKGQVSVIKQKHEVFNSTYTSSPIGGIDCLGGICFPQWRHPLVECLMGVAYISVVKAPD